MRANHQHLHWVRENILQSLSRVDQVICAIVQASVGVPGIRGDEPRIEQLFERRQGLKSTLAEVEQQIGQQRP